jgi:subtilisin family serine protease
VLDLPDDARDRLRTQGFRVIAERTLPASGRRATRLQIPASLTLAAARERVRAAAPAALVDRNTLYRAQQGSQAAAPCTAGPCPALLQVGWPTDSACGTGITIGLVDTAVDDAHPALAGARVLRATRRGPGLRPSSTTHGTAVAALLVGQGGLLPGATLVAVDAFHRRPDGDAADAFDLAAAIDLLAGQGVRVINLSVAGPPNDVLDAVGTAAAAAGVLAVVAVGNDGPRAEPRYPAAYDWSIGVTAVDTAGRVWPRAVQGPQVLFAAPGVNLRLAGRERTGTSFAAPFVTAATALMQREGEEHVVPRLAILASDLGEPGRDPVFGWGLIRPPSRC